MIFCFSISVLRSTSSNIVYIIQFVILLHFTLAILDKYAYDYLPEWLFIYSDLVESLVVEVQLLFLQLFDDEPVEHGNTSVHK
jgi:hypothetical protein